jgi:hypothetical protein
MAEENAPFREKDERNKQWSLLRKSWKGQELAFIRVMTSGTLQVTEVSG